MSPPVSNVSVALLRGINVGGRNRLAMADLRAIVAGCGCGEVSTYIQSGNVVLAAPTSDTAELAARLEAAIAAATDLTPRVVVLTGIEMQAAAAANPFTHLSEDPRHHHAGFAATEIGEALSGLAATGFEPERWAVAGRVVYLYLPNGLGRSKLAAAVDRVIGDRITLRNWRTVARLCTMVRETAARS